MAQYIRHNVLAVGLMDQVFSNMEKEWNKYSISAVRVNNFEAGISMLKKDKFALILIFVDSNYDCLPYIKIYRCLCATPIFVIDEVQKPSMKSHIIRSGADEYHSISAGTQIDSNENILSITASCYALIRRYTSKHLNESASSNYVMVGDVVVLIEHRCVFALGQEIYLARREFDLLKLFISNMGRVFTYDQLYENVWSDNYYGMSNCAIRNEIKRLREKLKHTKLGKLIKNVREVGYMMSANTM